MRDPADDAQRAVASPGGSTEAGLEALEARGAGAAFAAAVRRLAGEDEGRMIARRDQPRRRRRLRRRALFIVYIILIFARILISFFPRVPLQRARCARCSDFVTRRRTPTSTSSAASCRRSAAAGSRST